MLFTDALDIFWLPLILFGLLLIYVSYNLFFHPLRSFPGPWYCRISRIYYCYQLARGNLVLEIRRLHDVYGEVVRIAPNELSYNAAEAWVSIYGRNIQSNGESKPSATGTLFQKDPILYGTVLEGAETLIDAEGGDYTPQRRALAHAFTRKSLLTRENVISHYINHAIEQLKVQLKSRKAPVDMVPLFGNTLFDLSCKLTVDRDLGAINPHGKIHPSVDILDQAMKWIYIPVTARRFPLVSTIMDLCQGFLAKGLLHLDAVGPLVSTRLEKGGSDTDFVSYMSRHSKNDPTSQTQLLNNATIFIAAGTETTSTLLCGAIYYILSSPAIYAKLKEEIRGAAKTFSDLNLDLVHNMTYLKAVINECYRIYPPVPGTLTRVIPRGGAYICGRYVPQNAIVGVNQWATYHSATNFKHPDDFHPERWMDEVDEAFANDRRNALQPFNYGPRKCIANELSSMNSKLFLARLIWEFDMELDSVSLDWADQKGYMGPYKPDLMVKVTPRATN
ncbi:cytochrome P450 [Halenospora varia]|nr:cytochrome P450 [Halenospora varia]